MTNAREGRQRPDDVSWSARALFVFFALPLESVSVFVLVGVSTNVSTGSEAGNLGPDWAPDDVEGVAGGVRGPGALTGVGGEGMAGRVIADEACIPGIPDHATSAAGERRDGGVGARVAPNWPGGADVADGPEAPEGAERPIGGVIGGYPPPPGGAIGPEDAPIAPKAPV